MYQIYDYKVLPVGVCGAEVAQRPAHFAIPELSMNATRWEGISNDSNPKVED
jgi:hypothetical protein